MKVGIAQVQVGLCLEFLSLVQLFRSIGVQSVEGCSFRPGDLELYASSDVAKG